MASSCAAILDAWNIFDVVMVDLRGVFFEWQLVLYFIQVLNLLELFLVRVNLLFQVFNSLSHTLCDLKIMLDFFHRCSRFSLNDSIFSQSLMCVLQLSNLFLLELDFTHFSMVVSKLLIIVIVCGLLVLFNLIDWFFLFRFFLSHLRRFFFLHVHGLNELDLLRAKIQTRHLF